jgi:hypothetical protein
MESNVAFFLMQIEARPPLSSAAGEKRGQWASHELPISIKLSGQHM